MGACLHGAALYSCARRHRHGLEEGVNDGTGTGANPAKENPLSRAPFIGGNETGHLRIETQPYTKGVDGLDGFGVLTSEKFSH